MAELGIILFVKGIVEVVDDTTQETFSNELRGPNEFPFLFHSLPGMRQGGVDDVGVVGCWFVGDCVCRDAGEVVVFVDAGDFGE